MIITIVKYHKKNSKRCTLGYRKEALSQTQTLAPAVCRFTRRNEGGPVLTTILLDSAGTYTVELDIAAAKHLLEKLTKQLAEVAEYPATAC